MNGINTTCGEWLWCLRCSFDVFKAEDAIFHYCLAKK